MTKVEVRPFRSDVRELCCMLRDSWSQEHSAFYHLDLPQLTWLLNSPQVDRKWTLGCYRGRELIGFSLTLKKRIRLRNGRKISIAFNTLVATKNNAQAFMPYLRMAEHAAVFKDPKGYKLALGFVDGRAGNNRILKAYCTHRHRYFQKIRRFFYFVKRTGSWLGSVPETVPAMHLKLRFRVLPSDFSLCAALLNREPLKTFSEFWSPKALGYCLRGKYRLTCLAEKEGRVAGFLNGFWVRMKTANGMVPTLILSQACLYALSRDEKLLLIQALVHEAEKKGIRQIVYPDTGNIAKKIWLRAGFIRSFAFVNAYAVSKRSRGRFKTPVSFCMEVL